MPIITLNLRQRDPGDAANPRIQAGGTTIDALSETYGDEENGTPVARIGSSGHLVLAYMFVSILILFQADT